MVIQTHFFNQEVQVQRVLDDWPKITHLVKEQNRNVNSALTPLSTLLNINGGLVNNRVPGITSIHLLSGNLWG